MANDATSLASPAMGETGPTRHRVDFGQGTPVKTEGKEDAFQPVVYFGIDLVGRNPDERHCQSTGERRKKAPIAAVSSGPVSANQATGSIIVPGAPASHRANITRGRLKSPVVLSSAY